MVQKWVRYKPLMLRGTEKKLVCSNSNMPDIQRKIHLMLSGEVREDFTEKLTFQVLGAGTHQLTAQGPSLPERNIAFGLHNI
jgi:hypothetical protein